VSFSSPGNGERATARILKRGVAVAKKAAAKKTASAKSAVKKAETKQSAAKKAPAKKAPPKKTAAKIAPAKKIPAKKAAAVAVSESSKVDEARAAAAVRLKENQKVAAKAFTKPFLKKQEAELLRVREKYTRSAVSYREEADSLVLDRDPGDVQFDEESGEGDTLSVERERDLALSAQAQQAVEEIDAALQRLKDKVYGLCVESSLPIPKERLEAIPWASQRVEFKVGGLGRR
jgi:RNA polymerase-binding transcription factor DksA